jgi:hypothetical protein
VLVVDCESELSKVMPPLLKVLKELRNIDKSSIAELKVRMSLLGCLFVYAARVSFCVRC